ncbi:MAG TPA: N-acetylmuramoyl-L-alanine amidase [Chroococcales cyanobacterium]
MGNFEKFPNLARRIEAAHSDGLAKPAVISMPSPNASERPNGPHDIECIVLHHTARASIQSAPFVGRYFQNPQVKASIHYVVGPAGEIVQSVPDQRRALHAGPSVYRGRQNVNDFSIGVEVMSSFDHSFSEKQYQALTELISYLMKAHHIPCERVVAYREVSIAKARAPEAAAFDWGRLKAALGHQHPSKAVASKPAEGLKKGDLGPMVVELQEDLSTLGYMKVEEISGYFGDSTEKAIKLFEGDVGLEVDGIYSAAVKSVMVEVVSSLETLECANEVQPKDKKAKSLATAQLTSGSRDAHDAAHTQPLVPRTYKVRTGDSLAAIAKRFLGSSSRWQEIFLLNRNQLSNPDRVYPGMILRLA